MKPRYRPGKPVTGGRAQREAISKSNPLSPEQMDHLREEKPKRLAPKAGKGGHRANWDTDYEEGVEFDAKRMPHQDPQALTEDGLRRFPKKGH